jgi:hypothetical protein
MRYMRTNKDEVEDLEERAAEPRLSSASHNIPAVVLMRQVLQIEKSAAPAIVCEAKRPHRLQCKHEQSARAV